MPGLPLQNRATRPVALNFVAPASVTVTGSFAMKTLCKPGCAVDLAVQMPSSCFLDRDFKNHVYGDKRRLYLATLARRLAACPEVAAVLVEAFSQSIEKPVLRLTLGACSRCHARASPLRFTSRARLPAAAKSPFSLRIIPTLAAGVFKRELLLSGHGNVRR